VDEVEIRRRLAALGVESDDAVTADVRDDVVIVPLGDRFAFLAIGDDGLRRLVRERAVLVALHGRVSFDVPEVLRVADDGRADLRRGVIGTILGPDEMFAGLDAGRSRILGDGIGRLAAELHRAVDPDAMAGVLPDRPSWPEPTPWILERIPDVVDDPPLCREIADALAIFDAFVPPASDRVLVHTDVGLHNLVVDPRTWAVRGIFDFEGAAIADRHWDFRHLCWTHDRLATLDHAIAAYASGTRVELDRDRILLYNAATAFTYLAFRRGVPPAVRWCGRTLAEDLGWTRWALTNVRGIRPSNSAGDA
jgi:aminoglycoside phosphotransferase (APT) family kinase protein